MIDPHHVLILLVIAIWIDGLWLIKHLIWKRKPVINTSTTIKGKDPMAMAWEGGKRSDT